MQVIYGSYTGCMGDIATVNAIVLLLWPLAPLLFVLVVAY